VLIPFATDVAVRRIPFVTYTILAVLVAVWLLVQGAGSSEALHASTCSLGLVPSRWIGMFASLPAAELKVDPSCPVAARTIHTLAPLTPVTSLFVHGSWPHLISHLVLLWVFGRAVEASAGAPRFLAFYMTTGIAVMVTIVLLFPRETAPVVGAGGPAAAVFGAYLMLFRRSNVRCLLIVWPIRLRADVFILGWMAFAALGSVLTSNAVRWVTLQGFLLGALAIKAFVTAPSEQVWARR
jgi:membrane associated rhomboid family serine protease